MGGDKFVVTESMVKELRENLNEADNEALDAAMANRYLRAVSGDVRKVTRAEGRTLFIIGLKYWVKNKQTKIAPSQYQRYGIGSNAVHIYVGKGLWAGRTFTEAQGHSLPAQMGKALGARYRLLGEIYALHSSAGTRVQRAGQINARFMIKEVFQH